MSKLFEEIAQGTAEARDPQDVTFRLEELAALQNGWLDGTGVAPDKDALPKDPFINNISF